jgi:hypothetical protein
MLGAFLLAAILVAGFGNGPWWAWVVGGTALAILSLTDPERLTPRFAVLGPGGAWLAQGLFSVASGWFTSAAAFATGRLLWWAMPA